MLLVNVHLDSFVLHVVLAPVAEAIQCVERDLGSWSTLAFHCCTQVSVRPRQPTILKRLTLEGSLVSHKSRYRDKRNKTCG